MFDKSDPIRYNRELIKKEKGSEPFPKKSTIKSSDILIAAESV